MQNEDYKLMKSQDPDVEEAFRIVNQMPPEPPTPPQARVIHEGLGITRPSLKGEEPVDKNIEAENKEKLLISIKHGFNTVHRYFMWILIAMLAGAYIGISASTLYFNSKMNDAIKIEGMVYKDKIYNITPK